MMTSPWLEIIVIVASIAFIGTLLGIYIYKRIHHLPTGDCACCHKSKEQLLKEYHQQFKSK